MTRPDSEYFKAIIATLKSSNAVTDIVSARIYDVVPEKPVFPFIYVGDFSVMSSGDIRTMMTCSSTIHAFSNFKSKVEIIDLSAAITESLSVQLAMPSWFTAEWDHESTQYLTIKDGVQQTMLNFNYLVSQTA